MAPTGDAVHAHGHGRAAPVPLRTRLVLALLVLPALVATAWGVVALWPDPGAVPDRAPMTAEGVRMERVTVVGERDDETSGYAVRTAGGDQTVMQAPDPSIRIDIGDRVVALYLGQVTDGTDPPYVFLDFDRKAPLGHLVAVFVLVVLVVARWRGLAALAGLGIAFAVFVGFTIPALLAAQNALAVALVTSSAVMLVVLYLAHGFSARTTTALLGTLVGLGLTAVIGVWAVGAAHVTGATSEEALWLPQLAPGVTLPHIALCGLVLAGMGVLNDVTITQASAVWELRAAIPHSPRRALFARAMRIGRDHIASTVYTMAFAYVGAALAVLMNLWLMEQPVVDALSSGQIAEEVVRTLVASVGLVLAIPVTTAIAVLVVPLPADVGCSVPGSPSERRTASDAPVLVSGVDVTHPSA